MSRVTTMPVSGDWTVDDLGRLPDDGLRYELVDGVLLVSPSPLVPHQLALGDSTRATGTTLKRHVLEQAYGAREPFAVTVVPADLLH